MDLVGRKLGLRGGAVFADLLGRVRATATTLESAGPSGSAIATRLVEAAAEVEDSGGWLAEHGMANVNDALAGATPFLTMCSRLVGGWLLGVEALAAHKLNEAGNGDEAFNTTKIATARYFADNVLATVKGLGDGVRSGVDVLFAVPVDQY
jgi:hypothetical protein